MFTKISVLVPTRQRIARLKTLLGTFGLTRGHECAELVFRVDEDDAETLDFLYNQKVVVGPRDGGYLSMPRFFNELAAAATGDVLLCGNDDMSFVTPGWARTLLDVANQYPDGVFNLGVTTLNETHYPFSIVSKKLVETLGFLWDPRIFWGDMFLRDLMAWFDRCVMVPSVRINHDWAGDQPDRVYLETRPSKARIEMDASYWTGPHHTAVREAAEKIAHLIQSDKAVRSA
jgi:hypothetical protein